LVPGFALALWQRRFEIPLLAIIPVGGAFIARAIDNRLLMPIPFWVILIGFTVAWLFKLRPWPGVQIVIGVVAALILLDGLLPSVRYIYSKTKDPNSIHRYAQYEVAVSRFFKHVVAGQEHPDPPHLERNEFNRIEAVPDAPYDTFVCEGDAYSIIHLFLHDYDDDKILSFCGKYPFAVVQSEQDVWNGNIRTIASYSPSNKDLKLIWERHPKTERIISIFQSLRDLGTEDSLSYSFLGRVRMFYVLNIPNENIEEFQERVAGFPATPELSALRGGESNIFHGKAFGKNKFDSPTGMAVDPDGNVLVADTNNGRLQKLSSTGAFLGTLGSKGSGLGQLAAPNGIAVDHTGNIYVADAANHRVEKLASNGTLIAEWKGPDPGFYGPRRIAISADNSVYVVDQGHSRICKLSPSGEALTNWGSQGTGNGQFDDPTSVAVDPKTNKVYVADPRNKRIQMFDSAGHLLTKWSVPEWGEAAGFEDLAIDSPTGRLYASSVHMNAVIIFDLSGTRIGSLTPKPPDKLEGPSALALFDRKLYVLNMAGNRVSVIDL
jgi:DNA-binding beta-propeller fold protein YncE